MHLCSYQLRFQTPAFLGNAQQQGQWRVAATGAPSDSLAHTDVQVGEQVSAQVIALLQRCTTAQAQSKQALLAALGLSMST